LTGHLSRIKRGTLHVSMHGSFRVRGMSSVLAEGFCRGKEFLYICVDIAPDHEELI
jgi:crossover junction endodeoxyribonuclease RusA